MADDAVLLANDLDRLAPAQRAALTGPGAPFELTREPVRGVRSTVFAHRPRHLPDLLRSAADQHGDRDFLVFPDRRIGYRETLRLVAGLARHLRDAYGIRYGDRIAMAGPNSPEYALSLWAAAWLGAVSVGLNGWWTGEELRYGLGLADPALVLGEERQLARLAEGGREVAAVPVVPFSRLLAEAADAADAAAAEPLPVEPDLSEDDVVAILFTSGTTGRPKGAMVTHRGLANLAQDGRLRGAVDALLAAGAGGQGATAAPAPPVSLLPGPFFHISGIGPLLGSAPAGGTTLVFPPPGRWDPAVQLDLTARHGVTVWSGVPTHVIRSLGHPDRSRTDLSGLQNIGLGGAPIGPELTALVRAELPRVRLSSGYGMTETCGVGTTISGARLLDHHQSIGLACATAEVAVRPLAGDGDSGEDGPAGDGDGPVGEIWIRSPSTFAGYWRDPDATARVLDPAGGPFSGGGWYRTGDFGRITAAGMLQLESRLRDMVIRGGENIYPIEIENRLLEHPDLADAAVIGVPHAELGQEVLAVVVPRSDSRPAPAPAEVRAWAAKTLAGFKVPTHVRYAGALPYSATGKVLKRELERTVGDLADRPAPGRG